MFDSTLVTCISDDDTDKYTTQSPPGNWICVIVSDTLLWTTEVGNISCNSFILHNIFCSFIVIWIIKYDTFSTVLIILIVCQQYFMAVTELFLLIICIVVNVLWKHQFIQSDQTNGRSTLSNMSLMMQMCSFYFVPVTCKLNERWQIFCPVCNHADDKAWENFFLAWVHVKMWN